MRTKPENIRNFCIISHIDHGKSTLADRFLETTNTVEKRKMRAQYLDSMDIERERGITIKMQPVRMTHTINGNEYTLNLIDTPGHIDFSYEVSRSLAAVEGAVLLVDASQGIQAQTLSNVDLARKQNLKIIPVINKIDLPHSQIKETITELKTLLGFEENEILKISAKTGLGIEELLIAIVKKIPPPAEKSPQDGGTQALIFDFEYSQHQGVIAYIRTIKGVIKKGDSLKLLKAGEDFEAGEVGVFNPARIKKDELSSGEIGYIVTNIRKPETVKVGDTVTSKINPEPALSGYLEASPMVWASLYPASQDDLDALKKALLKLKLVDGSLSVEEESSAALGRGFACGFLGLLHMEIIIERIKREFGMDIVTTAPNVKFKLKLKNGSTETIHSASDFKDDNYIEAIEEPWAEIEILSPAKMVGNIFSLIEDYETLIKNNETLGERTKLTVEMPLRELMRDLHDNLKSASSGYASLSYRIIDYRKANLTRLDILIHEEKMPAFSQIVSPNRLEHEARAVVEKLKKIIPRQLFAFKIQAQARGRIIASESVSALKKDVTGYLYGGDRTRKMKLWKKQKEGKKRLKSMGSVSIPYEAYIKMLKRSK